MTYSGVVVYDEGNVTSRGLRIASAAAAMVVSAAVAGAALFGGTALSDPGAPNGHGRATRGRSCYSVGITHRDAEWRPPPDRVWPARIRGLSASGKRNRPSVIASRSVVRLQTRSDDQPGAQALHRRPLSGRQRRHAKTHSTKPKPTRKPTKTAKQASPKTTSSSSSGYGTRSDWANAVLDELNSERAKHGLPALKMNSKLVSAAHKHNLAMAKANTLSHQLKGEAALGSRVSAAGYRWSAVGENVAYNGRRSQDGVLAVQKAMYNEKPPNDGHRKNILSKTYVDVGIDVISDSVHSKVWLVTDFGKP